MTAENFKLWVLLLVCGVGMYWIGRIVFLVWFGGSHAVKGLPNPMPKPKPRPRNTQGVWKEFKYTGRQAEEQDVYKQVEEGPVNLWDEVTLTRLSWISHGWIVTHVKTDFSDETILVKLSRPDDLTMVVILEAWWVI